MSKRFKKNKPIHSINIGSIIKADFYKSEKNPVGNYLHIYSLNKVFEQRIMGFPYSYLLYAVEHGNKEEVSNYVVLLWRISQEIYQEEQFAEDILKAIAERDSRLLQKAAEEAQKIDDNIESANQAVMEDVADFADAQTNKERKNLREKWKKEITKEINRE